MAKRNPAAEFLEPISMDSRFRDFTLWLNGMVERDENQREGWISEKQHFHQRRYQEEFRNVAFPWPGASDIVPPLIDKKVDELKPLYINLLLGQKPPITALGISKDAQRNAPNVELWFDWLINHGGSPGFIQELFLFVDDILSMGVGVGKWFWRYETIRAPEVIDKNRLPASLRALVVKDTEDEADEEFFARGGKVLSKKEFKAGWEAIKRQLAMVFQLDPEERGESEELERVTSWFETGADEPLRIKKRDVVVNAPAWTEIHPSDFIVPSNALVDLESAERITQRTYLSARQLRQGVRDGLWDDGNVRHVLKEITAPSPRSGPGGARWSYEQGGGGSAYDEWRQTEAHRSHVTLDLDPTAVLPVYETSTWMSPQRGMNDRRVKIIYSPLFPEHPFKAWEYGSTSGRWNFFTVPFEMNVRQWHSSRGVGEKLDDLDRQIISSARARINNELISTAPTFKFRRSSRVNLRGHHWIPGQGIPVDEMDDLDVLPIPERQIVHIQEEQILRTWAEEYLGGTDFGLTSQNSLTEPRTATEIRGIQNRARQALSMRGHLFKAGMQALADAFFDMHMEYGDDEVWIAVTESEPIKLTREDLQGNYTFQIVPTIGEQDSALEAEKKLRRLQILMQAKQAGLEDTFRINLGEALIDYLESEDLRSARRIIEPMSEEEIAALRQRQAQIQDMAARAEANAGNTVEELREIGKMATQKAPHGKLQKII